MRYFDHLDDLPAYLAFIQRAFVPSLLVFNRRRPEDVVRSGWWQSHDPTALADEVRRFDGLAEAYVAAHAESALTVDYDAYCRNVDALRPLFAMLERPFDPAVVRRVLARRLTH